jgi:cold shock CspA family protein
LPDIKRTDQILYCERCGISFLWPVEEQKRIPVDAELSKHAPTRCPGCRQLLPLPGQERGEVKWYNPRKRYGFIVRANHPDIYVHDADIADSVRLRPGDLVEFAVERNQRGVLARDVRLLVRSGSDTS